MIVQPFIDRLEANRTVLGVKAVGDVIALMDAIENLVASPSLFVVRTGTVSGRATSATMVVRQDNEVRVDVMSGFTKAAMRGTTGESDTLTDRLVETLLGWSHPASDAALEYRGDGIARFDIAKGFLFVRHSFAFTRTLQG